MKRVTVDTWPIETKPKIRWNEVNLRKYRRISRAETKVSRCPCGHGISLTGEGNWTVEVGECPKCGRRIFITTPEDNWSQSVKV